MKLVKILLACTALVIVLFACRKERSLEAGAPLPDVQGTWEFQESGSLFLGTMDSAFTETTVDGKILSMGGTDTAGTGQIFIGIIGDIKKGKFTNSQVSFQFVKNDVLVYHNTPTGTDDFSITITAIDSASISGTFSGTVTDGQGNAKVITNGKFTAPLSRVTIPTEPTGTGQLTVWTKQLCSGNAALEILIGGQTGLISTALAAEPVCGAEGNTSFTLPAGPYTLIAVCGTDSVRYNVNIQNNICSNLEINLANPPLAGDYLPLNIGSFWNYQDLTSSTTNKNISDGTEEIDSRVYTRILDNFGDTMLYRKEGSIYYQYKTLNFDQSITDPPSVEIVILHDDYPVNQSWETPSIPITIQGIPLQFKLVSVITNRDFTEDFFGVSYSNLIEVNTSLFVSINGGATFDDANSSFSTIFAKGIGIVYYQDLNTNSQWGLTSYQLAP